MLNSIKYDLWVKEIEKEITFELGVKPPPLTVSHGIHRYSLTHKLSQTFSLNYWMFICQLETKRGIQIIQIRFLIFPAWSTFSE